MTGPSLDGLVGEPTEVDGAISPDPDTILVVVKNGRVNKVIPPGRRRRQGFGIPFFGDVVVTPITTGHRPAGIVLQRVRTRDHEPGFVLPEVRLQVEISLNSDDGCRAIKDRIQRDGYSFVETLGLELQRLVEEHVRRVLQDIPHEQIHGSALADLIPAGVTLGSILKLHSVLDGSYELDPAYEAIAEERTGLFVDAAAATREAANHQDRINKLGPVAQQIGYDIAWFLDADNREADKNRAHELAMKILDDPSLSRRSPELLQLALGVSFGTNPNPGPANVIPVAAATAASEEGSPGVPALELSTGLRLELDVDLEDSWLAAGGDDGSLVAAASAVEADSATAIYVLQPGAVLPDGLENRVKTMLGCEELQLVRLLRTGSADDLVADLVRQLSGDAVATAWLEAGSNARHRLLHLPQSPEAQELRQELEKATPPTLAAVAQILRLRRVSFDDTQ